MKQHLSNKETEELGESYIARYYKLSPSDSLCVDIEGFATECLGLDIQYRTFANEDSDTIGFLADGVTPVRSIIGTVQEPRSRKCGAGILLAVLLNHIRWVCHPTGCLNNPDLLL